MAEKRRRKRPRARRSATGQAPEQTAQSMEEGHMGHEGKLGIRFKNREAFGNFCVTLAADRVPFELAGFQTVILTQTQVDQLPPTSLRFYQACREDGRIEGVAPISAIGTHHVPTPEETERLLRELAEKY